MVVTVDEEKGGNDDIRYKSLSDCSRMRKEWEKMGETRLAAIDGCNCDQIDEALQVAGVLR